MNWRVGFVDDAVRAELEALSDTLRARFVRVARLIESQGIEKIREPYVKHLEGPLWEIRLKGKDGIARAIYVTAPGRRVVIVRVFVKKSRKTPRRELDRALRRAREIE